MFPAVDTKSYKTILEWKYDPDNQIWVGFETLLDTSRIRGKDIFVNGEWRDRLAICLNEDSPLPIRSS